MDTPTTSASIMRSVSTCYAILDFVKYWHSSDSRWSWLYTDAHTPREHRDANPLQLPQGVAVMGGDATVRMEWRCNVKRGALRACVIKHTVHTRSKKINRSKINGNGSCSDVIVHQKHCGSSLSPARVCQRDRNLLRVDEPARDCTWRAVTFECNPDRDGSAEWHTASNAMENTCRYTEGHTDNMYYHVTRSINSTQHPAYSTIYCTTALCTVLQGLRF